MRHNTWDDICSVRPFTVRSWLNYELRGHPSETFGLPGGGGLGKPDVYCYFRGNSIVKARQTGEGLKISQSLLDVLGEWPFSTLIQKADITISFIDHGHDVYYSPSGNTFFNLVPGQIKSGTGK